MKPSRTVVFVSLLSLTSRYRAHQGAVKDGVNQSCVKEFFSTSLLITRGIFWVYPSPDFAHFQAMARLWDLRTFKRATFSSSFKSLAIITAINIVCHHSQNAYSRWGGQFLEFNPRKDIVLDLGGGDKLDHPSRARTNLLLPLKKFTVPKGVRFGHRNRPGSPSFFGNLLRMTAEQFSFKGVLANSLNFSLFPIKVFKVEANLGMSIKASNGVTTGATLGSDMDYETENLNNRILIEVISSMKLFMIILHEDSETENKPGGRIDLISSKIASLAIFIGCGGSGGGGRIESSADKSLGDQEDASKQRRNTAKSDQDEPSTPPTTTIVIEDEDLIIAQTLMKIGSEKSKEKAKEIGSKEKSSEPTIRPTRGVTMPEPSKSGTRKAVPPSQLNLKDKGKAKTIKPEKPLKKKNQIKFDEVAKRLIEELKAELKEEERLDQRLQAEDQGELKIEERSRLFVELMDNRKKHFARLRAEKINRKPPTKVQKRNQMSTYLRNMAGYKHTQLKNKSFEEIQRLFDKEMKRVNSFVPIDSEVVESSRKKTISKKRAGEELDEESVKRQKLKDDAEKAEL
ncbi:hypothetical protein Tco_1438611 [Tanacetum coccineum]